MQFSQETSAPKQMAMSFMHLVRTVRPEGDGGEMIHRGFAFSMRLRCGAPSIKEQGSR
jgi:hypothetical protein